jgi:hypothetical protein
MASIKKRLERLEASCRARRGLLIIVLKPGETVEQAKQRHLTEHPEAKEAETLVIIQSASEDPPA